MQYVADCEDKDGTKHVLTKAMSFPSTTSCLNRSSYFTYDEARTYIQPHINFDKKPEASVTTAQKGAVFLLGAGQYGLSGPSLVDKNTDQRGYTSKPRNKMKFLSLQC